MAQSLPSLSSLLVLIMALLVLVHGATNATVSCPQVDLNMAPCLSFLTSRDSSKMPSDSCCSGMRKIKDLGKATADRQEICRCLEKAAKGQPDINPNNVPLLPGKCNITLGYPIAIDTDCSKIQ